MVKFEISRHNLSWNHQLLTGGIMIINVLKILKSKFMVPYLQ